MRTGCAIYCGAVFPDCLASMLMLACPAEAALMRCGAMPPAWLASMLMLACPPDRLRVSLVGGDGFEPPTLSV